MEPRMIYILDEKTPYAQLQDQIDKTQPLTKEQVVDLIISKIDGQDEIVFEAFKNQFETLSFQYENDVNKYEIFHKELKALEQFHQFQGTWNDPNELRSDLLNAEFSYFIEHEKTILYNRQIKAWINTVANWMVLRKKIDYLTLSLQKLVASNNVDPGTSNQSSIGLKKETPNLGNSSVKTVSAEEGKKKIPEKYYALLHMIYVNMDKVDPFNKLSDKKNIMAYGKENYQFKGTGQMFYKEIIRINDSKSVYRYIHECLRKDFRKWKRIIMEISENKTEVSAWIIRNKL